jgi:GGDEF domain-containing protein
MNKLDVYYGIVSENLSDVREGRAKLTVLQDSEAERLRIEATNDINVLFEKQDSATYVFFCRVAQRFLFVILFLVLTMSAGLFAISRSKKRDLEIALKLQSSKSKTAKVIQKAEAIAYTNVTTGLRNRYALTESLDQRLKVEDISLALYNYNGFRSLNEQYGREFADDFIAAVSKKIVEHFGDGTEIFTTDIDEMCVVFNKDVPKSKINSISEELLCALSQAYQVNGVVVQLTAAGIMAHLSVNSYTSASRLFMAMDHRMRYVKSLCIEQNRSLILPLQ